MVDYQSRREWRNKMNLAENIDILPQMFIDFELKHPVEYMHKLLYAFREFGNEHLYQLARNAFPGIEPDESRYHEERFIEYLKGIQNMPDFLTSIVENSVDHHTSNLVWFALINSTIDYLETPRLFLSYVKCRGLEPYVLHTIQAYRNENLSELAQNVFPGIEPRERDPLAEPLYFPEINHKGSLRELLILELAQPKLVDGVIEKTHYKMLRMANIIGDNELIEFVINMIDNMDIYDGTYQNQSLPKFFLRYLEDRGMERVMLNNNFTYALNDPIISQHILKLYGGGDDVGMAEIIDELREL
jgi:hypothetical protein